MSLQEPLSAFSRLCLKRQLLVSWLMWLTITGILVLGAAMASGCTTPTTQQSAVDARERHERILMHQRIRERDHEITHRRRRRIE